MFVLRFLLHRSRCSVLLSGIIPLAVLTFPTAPAAPGDINSINTGRDISSGTYFNTPGLRNFPEFKQWDLATRRWTGQRT